MSQKKTTIKLSKNGRPVLSGGGTVNHPNGWRQGSSNKGPAQPSFTKKRTGTRGDR